MLDRVGGTGAKLPGRATWYMWSPYAMEETVPDDTRRWPITLEEAAWALRQAAERIHAPEGQLVCSAGQFPVPAREPLQEEVTRWVLVQGHRLSAPSS